jgi:hypothetical protein
MPSADLSAEASAKAGRPLSSRDRFREVAALLAQGLLRLRTYPANQPPLKATAGKRPGKASGILQTLS